MAWRRVLPLAAACALLPATAGAAPPTVACDDLDPSACLHPWPNDAFTERDASTPTGRRLALRLSSMPRNVLGRPIAVRDLNRADGFSPGSMLITRVPCLDVARSRLVGLRDLARYRDRDQGVVVVDTATGRRHPVWAELDANPARDEDRALIVRPARNFLEGRRYVVALRGLRDGTGARIPAGAAFRAYRDGTAPKGDPRRAHMEGLFRTLRRAGIARKDLFLAWDFTVASQRSLAGRALHLRDDAFAQLGDTDLADLRVEGRSPVVRVNPDVPDALSGALPDLVAVDPEELDGVTEFPDGPIARRVTGTVQVPCYLDLPGCPPGSRFRFAPGSDVKPLRIPGNMTLANFVCVIPRRALEGGEQARPSLYGHGLLGSAGEVQAGNVAAMAQEHGYVFCATDWTGMSTLDVPNVATILTDLSRFPTLADRAQQGFLNFLYLGRAMIHPEGFGALPAFQRADGTSALDTTRLFYDGNSQGGIMGGALTALAPDFDRAVLGVPGMNYSTLLRRSSDFPQYAQVMYTAYPDELQRPLILSLIQHLWDRGEGNGYAQHMTRDPLPGTPPHEVLLQAAFGDHQVTNYAADVQARTVGARIHRPVLHSPPRPPWFGSLLDPLPGGAYDGSALVYYDTGPKRVVDGAERGTDPPPVENTAPDASFGRDPHGAPRADPAARRQKAAFLRVGGRVVDVCGGRPCRADGWPGP